MCVYMCGNLNAYRYTYICTGVSCVPAEPWPQEGHVQPRMCPGEGRLRTHLAPLMKGQREDGQHHGQQAKWPSAPGTKDSTLPCSGAVFGQRPLQSPLLGFLLVIRGREMRYFTSLSQKWANHWEGDLLFRYSCSGCRLYT